MANRTREKLIDVARHLFARKGIENTTMVDIANASDKGRRTVYTYFKSKRAIYEAVLENESERMVERLRTVYALDLPPIEKLRRFVVIRFEILKMVCDTPAQDNSLRGLFTRDNKRYERVLELALSKERVMLNDIFRQCLNDPTVDTRQLARLKVVMPLLQQGVDISFMRNNYTELGVDENSFANVVASFIIEGLIHKSYSPNNSSNNKTNNI
jgi:AcrR family transcriptional regulator